MPRMASRGVATRCIQYPQIGPRLPTATRATRNLRLVIPDQTHGRVRRHRARMWDSLGRNAAELPHLNEIVAPDSDHVKINIVNVEILTALTRNGQSAILEGAHLANWEISSALAGFAATNNSVVREQILSLAPWRRRGRRTPPSGPEIHHLRPFRVAPTDSSSAT